MQHDVFLSYSRKDTDIMQRVRDSLLRAGLCVWTDVDYEPGIDDWRRQGVNAIEVAKCCVAILTPHSNGSTFVEQQLDLVQKAGLHIFPVIGWGDEWSAIPKAFIGTQIIDVRANHEARMSRLIERIKSHLGIALE